MDGNHDENSCRRTEQFGSLKSKSSPGDFRHRSQKTKLPPWGLPLLSFRPEQMALITLSTYSECRSTRRALQMQHHSRRQPALRAFVIVFRGSEQERS
jgi:hypothetical protein